MTIEETTQSFVVRIWYEKEDKVEWRGHVKHVPSGKKFHFQTLEELSVILQRYINQVLPNP